MPAFLFEYLFSFVDVRMKYGIKINIAQILKILIIAARNGIYGLVGISHRI